MNESTMRKNCVKSTIIAINRDRFTSIRINWTGTITPKERKFCAQNCVPNANILRSLENFTFKKLCDCLCLLSSFLISKYGRDECVSDWPSWSRSIIEMWLLLVLLTLEFSNRPGAVSELFSRSDSVLSCCGNWWFSGILGEGNCSWLTYLSQTIKIFRINFNDK